jgi:hypothetical protein
MAKDISRWCSLCSECHEYKLGKQMKGLRRVPEVFRPFQRVVMDIIGPVQPLTEHGNSHVLVIIDTFTKWVECFAIPEPRYGCPESILTDGAKYFGNYFSNYFFAEFGIFILFYNLTGAHYHHQTQGLA